MRVSSQLLWLGASVACVLIFGLIAMSRGPDASWDLRNYHIYNPFALLSGRLDRDVAAAQLQTYYQPVTDIVVGWLRDAFNRTPAVFEFLMAAPHAVGALLAGRIAWKYVPAVGAGRWAVVIVVVAIGATGTASFGTLASVQSDIIPGCFILAGLLGVLHGVERPEAGAIWFWSGLSFGVAAGLKLTMAPYCVAGACAALAAGGVPVSVRMRRCILLCVGTLLSLAIVAGWWWVHLYRAFGNPLFPYYNDIFRSPYLPAARFSDESMKPGGVVQALLYAFQWGFTWTRPTSEATMRDPRFALAQIAVVAVIVSLVVDARTRRDRLVLPLVVFFAVSYGLWEAMFSIHRYLAPIEMLTGLMLFLALRLWCRGPKGRVAGGLAAALLIACIVQLTYQPDWGHARPSDALVDVRFPPIATDSLVILAENAPLSYVIPAAPSGVRFVSVNSNMLHPGQAGRLQEAADALANNWAGPLYSLETAEGNTQAVLSAYRLGHRGSCLEIGTNLEARPLHLCRLGRQN